MAGAANAKFMNTYIYSTLIHPLVVQTTLYTMHTVPTVIEFLPVIV